MKLSEHYDALRGAKIDFEQHPARATVSGSPEAINAMVIIARDAVANGRMPGDYALRQRLQEKMKSWEWSGRGSSDEVGYDRGAKHIFSLCAKELLQILDTCPADALSRQRSRWMGADEMKELLHSTHEIALRYGADTDWVALAKSITKLGIGPLTARHYFADGTPRETINRHLDNLLARINAKITAANAAQDGNNA